jgi:hypothetical protein
LFALGQKLNLPLFDRHQFINFGGLVIKEIGNGGLFGEWGGESIQSF